MIKITIKLGQRNVLLGLLKNNEDKKIVGICGKNIRGLDSYKNKKGNDFDFAIYFLNKEGFDVFYEQVMEVKKVNEW